MQRPANTVIDPVVFWIAAIMSALFVAWGILFTNNLAAVFDAVLFNFLIPNFGWVFILSSFGFLVFSLYLAFSRYGKVRLGGPDEQPEFRTVSWVAMMFSAGMGIGLWFSIFKALRSERVPVVEPGVAPQPERATTRPPSTPAPQQMTAVNPEAHGR